MSDYKIYWTKTCDLEGDQLICQDSGEVYEMADFMRSEHSDFDGICGISNTSALAVTLSDDFETAILNCIG
jgi:hypothetical protein|tara:strand:- start:945 stop:1157 length:213 start_codon:yes stop_codon:yes gene_type:complete